jgi:(p)ppGpp synthase/HD superfamily hydrolase
MPETTNDPILTERFHHALYYASKAHVKQVRKGKKKVPYVSHLLAVCSIVLEQGGDEDEAIAALLHDLIEDVEGFTKRDIHVTFGERVADIVEELSEDKSLGKPACKIAYANSVLTMSESAVRISYGDKLHNLRCYAKAPELFKQEHKDFYRLLRPNYEQRLGREATQEMRELLLNNHHLL